ncbi:MAG: DUF1844 domain-containing protein [candidate division NC10 bacterium]|nr:DUF1844 domain-containing protein [candidate division NC10 bacterium]
MASDEDRAAKAKDSTPGLFEGLLVMLSSAGLESLGEVATPEGKEPPANLAQAQYMIDLLGVLQEKTQGNLTTGEAGLLEHLLFDLRMRYLKKAEPS